MGNMVDRKYYLFPRGNLGVLEARKDSIAELRSAMVQTISTIRQSGLQSFMANDVELSNGQLLSASRDILESLNRMEEWAKRRDVPLASVRDGLTAMIRKYGDIIPGLREVLESNRDEIDGFIKFAAQTQQAAERFREANRIPTPLTNKITAVLSREDLFELRKVGLYNAPNGQSISVFEAISTEIDTLYGATLEARREAGVTTPESAKQVDEAWVHLRSILSRPEITDSLSPTTLERLENLLKDLRDQAVQVDRNVALPNRGGAQLG